MKLRETEIYLKTFKTAKLLKLRVLVLVLGCVSILRITGKCLVKLKFNYVSCIDKKGDV